MSPRRTYKLTTHVKRAVAKIGDNFEPQLIEVLFRILKDTNSLGHALLKSVTPRIEEVCRSCRAQCIEKATKRTTAGIEEILERANRIALDHSAYFVNSLHIIAALITDNGDAGTFLRQYLGKSEDWVMAQFDCFDHPLRHRPPIKKVLATLRVQDPAYLGLWHDVFRVVRRIQNRIQSTNVLRQIHLDDMVHSFAEFRGYLRAIMLHLHELDLNSVSYENWRHYLNYTLMMLGGVYDDYTTLNLDYFFHSLSLQKSGPIGFKDILKDNERFYLETVEQYDSFVYELAYHIANSAQGVYEP